MKLSAKSSSKTSNLPSPWTSSVFRRTTAFAASEELTLLILLPLFPGSLSPACTPSFRENNLHDAPSSLSLLRQLGSLRIAEQPSDSVLYLKLRYWIEFSGILFQQ